MNNSGFLNTGLDIIEDTLHLLQITEKPQQKFPELGVFSRPVNYLLNALSLAIDYFTVGIADVNDYGIPGMIEHFKTATPNSLYCFNKTGFLIIMIDVYFICYYFVRVCARPERAYMYLILKWVAVVMPFMELSPADHWTFWPLSAVFTGAECCLGLYLIVS
jgi:hypothetical protein